jgi:hypothetical protein
VLVKNPFGMCLTAIMDFSEIIINDFNMSWQGFFSIFFNSVKNEEISLAKFSIPVLISALVT